MIILNRIEYFNKLYEFGFEKGPNKRDMMVLARVYQSQGFSKDAIRNSIITFCKRWNEDFNTAKYESAICSILNDLDTEDKLSKPVPISFSRGELERIKGIGDKGLENVVFIMMCLAKIKGGSHIYLNKSSSIKLDDIYKLSRIEKSKKQQDIDLHLLYNMGVVSVDLKPILRYTLNYCEPNGDKEIEFYPSENMIFEYLLYTGRAIRCERCGGFVIKRCNKTKYCTECARIVNIEKTNAKKKR